MKVKQTDGSIKDVPITEVTAENYIVPENEKHLYHVVIEVRKFNAETGERLSKPRVQKFGKKAYETKVRKNLVKQGYTITMLHEAEEVPEAKLLAPVSKTNVEAIVAEAVAKALAEKEAQHKAEVEEAVNKALAEANKTTKKGGRKPKAEKEAEAAKAAEAAEAEKESIAARESGEEVETPTEEF